MHIAFLVGTGFRVSFNVLRSSRQHGHTSDKRQGEGSRKWFILRGQSAKIEGERNRRIVSTGLPNEDRTARPTPRKTTPMQFHGSSHYVATQDLMLSVNAAITLQRPLLIKGEPGTGKTMLAEEVAQPWACHCCSGTSNRPPRPSRACTSTTQ